MCRCFVYVYGMIELIWRWQAKPPGFCVWVLLMVELRSVFCHPLLAFDEWQALSPHFLSADACAAALGLRSELWAECEGGVS